MLPGKAVDLRLQQARSIMFSGKINIVTGFGFLMLFMLYGFLLIYLGSKNILEPLLMIPMGLGMSAVNAGVMFLDACEDH